MDIFGLIKQDHQEVAGLFKKLHDAQGTAVGPHPEALPAVTAVGGAFSPIESIALLSGQRRQSQEGGV